MVWKASYGPVPLARALKGSGAMPLPPKNNVSDFSLYNKKKCCSKGGLQPPQPLPWIRLWLPIRAEPVGEAHQQSTIAKQIW